MIQIFGVKLREWNNWMAYYFPVTACWWLSLECLTSFDRSLSLSSALEVSLKGTLSRSQYGSMACHNGMRRAVLLNRSVTNSSTLSIQSRKSHRYFKNQPGLVALPLHKKYYFLFLLHSIWHSNDWKNPFFEKGGLFPFNGRRGGGCHLPVNRQMSKKTTLIITIHGSRFLPFDLS